MAPRQGDSFGRPAPPHPPKHTMPPRPQGHSVPPHPPRHPVPPGAGSFFGRPASPMPPRMPRHGSLAGDILIGGMLAGLGELLEESMDTSASEAGWNTEYSPQSVKLPSECPFCGAPVVSSVCDYCGRNVAQNG